MLKFNEIVKFADKCIYNVEHKQTASIDPVRNYTTLAYLFSKAILRIGKDTGIKRIKENPKRVGYPLDKNVNKNSYLEACRWYVTWCDMHNNTAPSHVQIDKGVAIWVWTYEASRRYTPASSGWASTMLSTFWVAPWIGASLKYHW